MLDVTPCRWVNSYRRFDDTTIHRHIDINLPTDKRHISEDVYLQKELNKYVFKFQDV
jgi:hypothetical protein